jgi:hypothetical protein
MTKDELQKLVHAADCNAVAAALKDLSESERAKLAKAAVEIAEKLEQKTSTLSFNDFSAKNLARVEKFGLTVECAGLAVLGLSSSLRDIACHFSKGYELDSASFEPTMTILGSRSKSFVDAFVIAAMNRHVGCWEFLRELIRRGICAKPKHERYVECMDCGLSHDFGWEGKYRPLSERLKAEPELLEDEIWRLFETENGAFTNENTRFDRNPKSETWAVALKRLSDEGVIDRQRLLDCSLTALQSDFKRNRLTGYAQFHETMDPTAEEMRSRQGRYMDLLTVPTTQVASFATNMIKKIDQAKALDDAAFVGVADRVFAAPVKGSAITVLGILEKIGTRSPELLPQAARVVADHVLLHPVNDVQAAALKLLTKWQTNLEGQAAEQIAVRLSERLTDLPATLRSSAQKLIEDLQGTPAETAAGGDSKGATRDKGKQATKAAAKTTRGKSNGGKPTQGKSTERGANEFAPRIAACQAAANRLPAHWRKLAGVDQATSACVDGTWPEPLEFDLMSVPLLTGLKPVPPLETVDDLLDAIAHAIENVDSAIELERIFDGISRFGLQDSAKFRRRAAPLLVRRKKTQLKTRQGLGVFDADAIEPFLLVAHWLGGSSKATDNLEEWELRIDQNYLLHFMDRRIGKLRERVLAGLAGPLLSAPTHEGGWIDATILVERWRQIERMKHEPDRLDIIQALLRLAPDRRSDALGAGQELSHPCAGALRWALGADEAPPKLDAESEPVWLAAARARVPRGHVPGTENWTWTGRMAGLASGRESSLLPETVLTIDDKMPVWEEMAVSRTKKDGPLEAIADMPTVLVSFPRAGWGALCMQYWPESDPTRRVVEWISLAWPGDAEPFFARGLPAVGAPHALHEPDRPWGDRSRTAVILATAADKQDFRRAAIDALIDGIGDGRVSPRTLGETLGRVAISMASTCADLKQLSTRVEELAKTRELQPEAAEELAGLAASLSSKSVELKPLSKRFSELARLASRYLPSKREYKESIEKAAASKTFKLNRLCAAFSEVSRVSSCHAWVIAGALETLLESYASPPDDVHHLLSLLLELMTQLGLAPGDEARAKLAAIKGAGKTASLAKSLAALEPQQTSAAVEARVICAEKRLERAQRWGSGQTSSETTASEC